MKHTIALLLMFISCATPPVHQEATKSDEERPEYVPCSFEHYKADSIGYSKYQTFDEHLMQGKGRVFASPYVLVKRIKDTIVVKSSSKIDSMRVYYKLPCGTWYSHMDYDMWKKDNYQIVKSEWDKIARTYNRYFYNDTILEILDMYYDTKKLPSIAIVKTDYTVFTIDPYECTGSVSNIRNKIYSMTKENSHNTVTRYSVIEKQDTIFYVNDSKKYSYIKSSQGLWGLQPGIEETRIYAGQDIRNFTHSHPNGIILDNDTAVYELADQMPTFPGGFNELNKILHVKTKSKISFADKRIRIVVECIVEKDGSLSNLNIKDRSHGVYDEKAIMVVRKIDRFTPAVLNGKKVRCRYFIPVSFLFE